MTEFQSFRAMPFSALRTSAQADQLGALVRGNAEWLKDSVYQGAMTRFDWQATAANRGSEAHVSRRGLSDMLPPKLNARRHVARMALFHSTHHSYILEAQPAGRAAEEAGWQPVGMGTVTRGVNAILDGHPDFPSHNLTDVDYWLDASAENTALHGAAARTMVDQARRRVRKHEDGDTVNLLASIVPNIQQGRDMGPADHQPVGFGEFMYPPNHGEAVPISMIGKDPYGISKGLGRRLSVLTLKVPANGPLEL